MRISRDGETKITSNRTSSIVELVLLYTREEFGIEHTGSRALLSGGEFHDRVDNVVVGILQRFDCLFARDIRLRHHQFDVLLFDASCVCGTSALVMIDLFNVLSHLLRPHSPPR